jgi:hypothetical protein
MVRPQLNHAIQYSTGDVVFVGQSDCLQYPACTQNGDRVGVMAETHPWGRYIIGDNEVEILSNQLVLSVHYKVFGLGCKSDEYLALALAST